MTTPKHLWSRRPVIGGLAAIAAAVVAGIGFDIVSPHHKRATGPDANLINAMEDPGAGAVVGEAILAHAANRENAIIEARAFAKSRLPTESLAEASATDAKHGFLTETNGWVLPITLGALCVLATQS